MSELKETALQAAINTSPSVNHSKVDLTREQIRDLASHLPPPQAMEGLFWQNVRLVITGIGGMLVTLGIVEANGPILELVRFAGALIGGGTAALGLLIMSWPAVFRNWTTIKARYAARRAAR